MRVIFARRAKAERNHALAALDDPAAAARLLVQFDMAAQRVGRFPFLGRAGQAGTRELVIAGTPYRFIYEIVEGRITVLEIRHSSRG